MKITQPSSSISKEENSQNKNPYIIHKGITKKLLEKYKPKGLHEVETLGERKNQKRVA